jgi:hypothetical protein
MLAIIVSPFVFVTSMLWAIRPLDFAFAKIALKRNYLAAWGVVLLLPAVLAIIGTIARHS